MSDELYTDLREFLAALRRDGDLVEIETEVDPRLELAEVHRRVIAAGGPALLHLKTDVEAITPTTTISALRESSGFKQP